MRNSSILPLLTIAALVVGCTGADDRSTGGPADAGGTLVIAVGGDADVFFPALTMTASGRALTDVVFDRLAEIGPELNTVGDKGFEPRLAKSWTWAPDSLSIAFQLDARARWHDGRPVRAGDVKFSFDLARDPSVGSASAPLIGNIDSVTVRDSLTAVAWYHRRTPEQFYDLTYQIWVVPEHVYGPIPRAELKTSDILRRPVGSGRFRFVRWEPGVRFEVTADTANYRGRAKLDRVIWTITPDPTAGPARVLAGDADFWENLLPDHLSRFAADSDVRVQPYPGLQFAAMYMNFRDRRGARPHPIFGDAAVRRALSMAVDRRAMLRNVFDTVGKLAYGPFAQSQSIADTTLRLPLHDVARAKTLLDSAGWRVTPSGYREKQGRSLEFTLLVPSSSRARMAYTVLLQSQLREVGAKVNVEQVDFPTFFSRQNAKDFDAAMISVSGDPSPSGARQFWHSASATKDGANYVWYANPRFDVLIDSAIASFDPAATKRYASRAFQVLVDDAPAIWLYEPLTLAGVHRRVRTPGMRADGYWAGLPEWNIPASERIARDRIGLAAASP